MVVPFVGGVVGIFVQNDGSHTTLVRRVDPTPTSGGAARHGRDESKGESGSLSCGSKKVVR